MAVLNNQLHICESTLVRPCKKFSSVLSPSCFVRICLIVISIFTTNMQSSAYTFASSSARNRLRQAAPYELVKICNKEVYIKRADKIWFHGVSGNKAYKLFSLAETNPFPSRLASVGGFQSNMMLALAQLAKNKNSGFTYYTKKLPNGIQHGGNFAKSKSLGMEVY